MWRKSDNIVHRLFDRQIRPAAPNAHIHRARTLYENIVPNQTVYDIECPDYCLRKFSNDGQYLICFSRNYQDLIVFRYIGLSYCCKGENSDIDDELPLKAKKFESYFSQLYSLNLASGSEIICKDSFLVTDCNCYGIFATATTPDSEAPATFGVVSGVPSIEKTTLYIVRLADGNIMDERNFHNDFIHLGHSMGIFMYDDLISVLSVRHQTIHILQVRETGMFVDVRRIGSFCREDDELILSSHLQQIAHGDAFPEKGSHKERKHSCYIPYGALLTAQRRDCRRTQVETEEKCIRKDVSISGGSSSSYGSPRAGGTLAPEASVEYVVSRRDTANEGPSWQSLHGAQGSNARSASLPSATEDTIIQDADFFIGSGLQNVFQTSTSSGHERSRLSQNSGRSVAFIDSQTAGASTGPSFLSAGALNGSSSSARSARPNSRERSPSPARPGHEATSVNANLLNDGGIANLETNRMLGGMKQRLLSFIFRSMESQEMDPHAKAQRLKRFYYNFQHYVDLVMWKVQFLDRYHLLIKFGSAEGALSHNSDVLQQTTFFVVYNIESTEILGFHQNSSEELLRLFEQYYDHFRVAARYPLYMRFISSYANNKSVRDQLRKQKMACNNVKSSSYSQVVKRTLASLPCNSQSSSPSAYFDQSLFHFDEKLISASDQYKPCMEHPIKFILRRKPNTPRFKINPGPEFGTGDGRSKKVVSFIFHPIFPFAISVQQAFMQPSVVNLHVQR